MPTVLPEAPNVAAVIVTEKPQAITVEYFGKVGAIEPQKPRLGN